MRWQDALTEAARNDFDKWVTTERSGALERIISGPAEKRDEEIAFVKALDRLRHAVVAEEHEVMQRARYGRSGGRS
jgi:hypothetical protein